MAHKLLIPLMNDEVAPRFDLATDVMLVRLSLNDDIEERIIVLPQASADDLCALGTAEKVDAVICGGIDEEHYQYLKWKGIDVLDDVIGPVDKIVEHYRKGNLKSGMYLHSRSALPSEI